MTKNDRFLNGIAISTSMAKGTIEIEPGMTVEFRKCPESGNLITVVYDPDKAGVMDLPEVGAGDPCAVDDMPLSEAMAAFQRYRAEKAIHPDSLLDYAAIRRRQGKPVDVRHVGVSDGLGTLVRHQVVDLRNVPSNMRKTGTYDVR